MTEARPKMSEALEAGTVGKRLALGQTSETLHDVLTGSGVGSDTRAGSLQDGAATGSDDDPDQAEVDRVKRAQGQAFRNDGRTLG
jgi:hypothetical protein